MTLAARPASPEDAAILAQIYNEGIEDRVGTFETRPRTAQDVLGVVRRRPSYRRCGSGRTA